MTELEIYQQIQEETWERLAKKLGLPEEAPKIVNHADGPIDVAKVSQDIRDEIAAIDKCLQIRTESGPPARYPKSWTAAEEDEIRKEFKLDDDHFTSTMPTDAALVRVLRIALTKIEELEDTIGGYLEASGIKDAEWDGDD